MPLALCMVRKETKDPIAPLLPRSFLPGYEEIYPTRTVIGVRIRNSLRTTMPFILRRVLFQRTTDIYIYNINPN